MPGAAGIRVVIDLEGFVRRTDGVEQALGAFHIHQPVVGAVGDQGRAFDPGRGVAQVKILEDLAGLGIGLVAEDAL